MLTRKHIRFILLLTVSLTSISSVIAQYKLTDQMFIDFLKNKDSSLVSINDELNISKANSFVTTAFDLSRKGLLNIDGIQYFSNLQDLDVSNNNISSLPDLKALTNLKTLNISFNLISELQEFDPLVFSNLETIDVGNNHLYFDDYSGFPSIAINKESQRLIKITTPDTLFIGDTLRVDLSYDTHISNFHVLIERPTLFELADTYTTELEWLITDTAQSGTYYIDAINTTITGHRYLTNDFTIVVLKDRPIIIPVTPVVPIAPKPVDLADNDQTEIIPDGTPEEQTMYIEGDGEAVIFNKSGSVYNRFQLPYEWDGSDENGTIIPGYYLIKLEDDSFLKVTVIY